MIFPKPLTLNTVSLRFSPIGKMGLIALAVPLGDMNMTNGRKRWHSSNVANMSLVAGTLCDNDTQAWVKRQSLPQKPPTFLKAPITKWQCLPSSQRKKLLCLRLEGTVRVNVRLWGCSHVFPVPGLGYGLGLDSEGDVLGRKSEGKSWRKIKPWKH